MVSNLRPFRALPFLFVAAFPLAIGACDDDDDDRSSTSLTGACAQYFDALQSFSGRCLYGFPTDRDFVPSARDSFTRYCSRIFSLPGAPAGFGSTLSRCAAALGISSCDAINDGDALGCSDLVEVRGTRAAGEPCEDDVQCASAACSQRSDAECGVCARDAGEGESCAEDGVTCGAGLYCDFNDDDRPDLCRRKGPAGAACERRSECEDGLLCDGGACKPFSALPKAGEPCADRCAFGSACGDGTCVVLPQENQPCLSDDRPVPSCALGLDCDEAGNVCKRRFTGEVDPGGACDDDTFCKGGTCAAGRCVAYAKLGEACSDGDGGPGSAPPCEDDYECTAGACAEVAVCLAAP
jgi:hypothetical protein